MSDIKCVLVIDDTLPLGLIANAAAFLALTLGQRIDNVLGPDVLDSAGNLHPGICTLPIPILRGPAERIKAIYTAALEHHELVAVGFSNAAHTTLTYADYQAKIAAMPAEELAFLGVALYGPKRAINRLTGALALLR
jgi:hypothetical protein